MTIRPVHVEHAMTKAQYDALDLTRPLCDGPIGSTTVSRRATDEAASRAWEEPDRPAVTSKRRAVGPARTALQPDDGDRNRTERPPEGRVPVGNHRRAIHTPRNDTGEIPAGNKRRRRSMNRTDITEPPSTTGTVEAVGAGSITYDGGWSIGCDLPDVAVGDLVESWGRGIGYPVRGLAVGGRVAWYRTEDEQEAHQRDLVEASERSQRERFEQHRAEYDAQYEALPVAFQRRIDRFRRDGGPDWRWKFEPYEMMVCTDAVKIAEWCLGEGMTIGRYATLAWGEQAKAGIDDGHSGNSFSCAVQLARLWGNGDAVVEFHGALTPLVGCDDYGCRHSA